MTTKIIVMHAIGENMDIYTQIINTIFVYSILWESARIIFHISSCIQAFGGRKVNQVFLWQNVV